MVVDMVVDMAVDTVVDTVADAVEAAEATTGETAAVVAMDTVEVPLVPVARQRLRSPRSRRRTAASAMASRARLRPAPSQRHAQTVAQPTLGFSCVVLISNPL